MNVDAILSLPEKVAKLPEVGGSMTEQAENLALRAQTLKTQYETLIRNRDDFLTEVHELWTRKERKESGL